MKNKLLKKVLGRRYKLADAICGLDEELVRLVKDYQNQETITLILAGSTWSDVKGRVGVSQHGWASRRAKALRFLKEALTPLKDGPFVVDVMALDIPDETYRSVDIESLIGLEPKEFNGLLSRLKQGKVHEWMDLDLLDHIVRVHWPLPPTLLDFLMLDGPVVFQQHIEKIATLELTPRQKEMLRYFSSVSEGEVCKAFQVKRQAVHQVKKELLRGLDLYGHSYLRRVLRQPSVIAWRAFLCGEPLSDFTEEARARTENALVHALLTSHRIEVLQTVLA